ncbi:Hypothetical protein HDN1F_12840 [gamma proteobacterium HdN1]|nr:Hypothetical protein HDN1F_12840 [gamma proteobacterium HdN1]
MQTRTSFRIRAALFSASLTLSTLCLPAFGAAEPAVMLHGIFDAHMSLLQTSAAFQGYQGAEGDPKRGATLNAQLANTRATMATLESDLAGAGVDTELAEISASWKSAQTQLDVAMQAIASTGFAEFAVMDAYLKASDQCEALLGKLQSRIVESTRYQVTPIVQQLRSEALLLQQMTAAYVERSNSQFGSSYRAGQEEQETIDAMAVRFSHGLDKLLEAIPAGNPNRPQIERVRTNWGFMKKSFMNYTENSVPFLVSKFSGETITLLSELAQTLEGKK